MRAFSPKGKRIAVERGLQQVLQEPARHRLEEEFARKMLIAAMKSCFSM